jgi:hypothetical protein
MDQAYAGAKPDQINRLSEDLTPMGSERAGNADGTIPAWTGGITEPPAGYSPGDHHPTPWPDDKPQFRITGANPLRSIQIPTTWMCTRAAAVHRSRNISMK